MSSGLSPGAKVYCDGETAGRGMMYHAHRYPSGAIGPVEFLWQPSEVISGDAGWGGSTGKTGQSSFNEEGALFRSDSLTKIWLIVSPAIYDEVMAELSVAVQKFSCHGDASLPGNEVRSSVTVTSLKDEFVRFRMIGPRSHAVVMETLKPTSINISEKSSHTSSLTDFSDIPVPIPWWNGNESLKNHSELIRKHYKALKNVASPSEFPRGTILGLTVHDPRLFTPTKKTDMVSRYYPKKKTDWWARGGGEEREREGGEREGVEREEGKSKGDKTEGERMRETGLDFDMENVSMMEDDGKSHQISDHIETETKSLTSDKRFNPAVDSVLCPLLKGLAYSPLWCPRVRILLIIMSLLLRHMISETRNYVDCCCPWQQRQNRRTSPVTLVTVTPTTNYDREMSSDDCYFDPLGPAGWGTVPHKNLPPSVTINSHHNHYNHKKI